MKNRVKIHIDGTEVFKTTITLSVSDMNYGNHLGNDKVLSLAHEARIRWLESLNASELDCMGCSLIMSDAMVEYKGEGFRGDQVEITVYLSETHKYGFDLFYEMTGPRGLVAKVKSGLMFFDYETRKVANAPEQWIKYHAQSF
ncbi:MAG: thioesterase [Halobacteriovorax sp.]|nr:thioesterase [Halobacteriovorax sp.]